MFSNNQQEQSTQRDSDTPGITNIAIIVILCFSFFMYFGYTENSSKDDSSNVIKIRPSTDDGSIYYHNKTYVHPKFTIPQITIKLLNENNLYFESSINPLIFMDYVFSWKFKEDSRIHFIPYKEQYGLISISASKTNFKKSNSDRNFTYFALIRADRKICEDHSCNSWTCQKDHDYFNNAYDSTYCIIVLKTNRLMDIFEFTHDFIDHRDIPSNMSKYKDMSLGMFCGNPLISRTANTDKDLFFVNFNVENENNKTQFFICRFSSILMDVNECFNTEIIAAKLNVPLMLLHDPTTDVLMTANYNPDDKNLHLLTFNCNRLSFKAAFRSIPAPSGS